MSLTAKLADRLRTMFDNQPCERSLLAAQTIELMIDQKIHELRKELIPMRSHFAPTSLGQFCDCTSFCMRQSKNIDPKLCKAGRASQETSPAPRGKPCTCDTPNGGSIPCYVDSGGKLGELWYCRKRAETNADACMTKVRQHFDERRAQDASPPDEHAKQIRDFLSDI